MAWKIEKKVPIPSKNQTREDGPVKKCFKAMAVGDSVLVKDTREAAQFYYAAKQLNGHIISRRVTGGIRVWRVK